MKRFARWFLNFINEEKQRMTIYLRVVQDADGNDVGISNPNYGVFSEEDVKAWAEEGSRILENHPEMIPLFQNGAILEAGIRKPHEVHEYSTSYMGLQIAGVKNKDKKDTRRDYGHLSLSRRKFNRKERPKDVPHCSFDVRLRYTGVIG